MRDIPGSRSSKSVRAGHRPAPRQRRDDPRLSRINRLIMGGTDLTPRRWHTRASTSSSIIASSFTRRVPAVSRICLNWRASGLPVGAYSAPGTAAALFAGRQPAGPGSQIKPVQIFHHDQERRLVGLVGQQACQQLTHIPTADLAGHGRGQIVIGNGDGQDHVHQRSITRKLRIDRGQFSQDGFPDGQAGFSAESPFASSSSISKILLKIGRQAW